MIADASPLPNPPPQAGEHPGGHKSASAEPTPIELYLQHLAAERRLSPHSVLAAQRDLARLGSLTGNPPLAELTLTDIRSAIVKLRGQGLSAASVARHLSSWRGFYHFACRRLGYTHNPCVGLRPPKAAKRLPDTLTPDACAQMLDGSKPDDRANPALEARDRAMFELLYSSGLRLAELVGLDIGGIDLASGEAEVTGKGRKTRRVPVGSQACAALTAWLSQRASLARDTAALFVSQRGDRLTPRSVQLRLDRWARRAGTDQQVHPHLLRHAFATHVLQSSGDLRAVQDMLGHASISTTQVYTHLDWQHLAKVYDTAHPRARKKS